MRTRIKSTSLDFGEFGVANGFKSVFVNSDVLDDILIAHHLRAHVLELVFELVRQKSPTIKLANKTLGSRMDRHTKSATLRRLEQAGLITVQWRPRKSPLVTILFPQGHPAERHWR